MKPFSLIRISFESFGFLEKMLLSVVGKSFEGFFCCRGYDALKHTTRGYERTAASSGSNILELDSFTLCSIVSIASVSNSNASVSSSAEDSAGFSDFNVITASRAFSNTNGFV